MERTLFGGLPQSRVRVQCPPGDFAGRRLRRHIGGKDRTMAPGPGFVGRALAESRICRSLRATNSGLTNPSRVVTTDYPETE